MYSFTNAVIMLQSLSKHYRCLPFYETQGRELFRLEKTQPVLIGGISLFSVIRTLPVAL